MTRLIAAAVLTAGVLGWVAPGRALAANGEVTEKLLKSTKLDYKKVKDGAFKLVIDEKPGIAVIYVEEKVLGKDRAGNELLYVYIYTEVFNTATDFKPPTAMLTKINEVNDRILFGSLSLAKNKDNSHSMFRNCTGLLKNMEAEQLVDLISMAYFDKFRYQKDFRGFLEAGQ